MDIENFGPFYDRSIGDLSPGLTVLHGPNEAGKSALRAYIRTVFFGFMRKDAKGYDFYSYPPIHGGAASGSIDLQMSDGAAYTVHRKEGTRGGPVRITGHGGADNVESLIGRVGPELYQNLFSVSLSELQAIESLNAPQIRDRIYSVGLGLSRVSLPDAMERLDEEIRALRGPRSGTIRDLEKRLSEVRGQLEKARADGGRYEAVVARHVVVERDIAVISVKLDELRARLQRQRQLITLRPHWERLQELERQLGETADAPGFPPDGEVRLEGLLRDIASVKEQVEQGEGRQNGRKLELGLAPVVAAFTIRANDIRRLLKETEHYRKAVEDLPKVERELHDEQTKLAHELAVTLGPDWTEQRLAEFAWPADFNATMENAGRALAVARNDLNEAEAELRHRTEDHAGLVEAMQRANAARDAIRDAPPEAIDVLSARSDKLRNLRAGISEAEVAEREQRDVERRLAEGLARVQPESVNAFIFTTIWFAVLVMALGLGSLMYGLWQKELSGAIPGLLSVGAGVLFLVRARMTGKGMKIVLRKPKAAEANDVLKKQLEAIKARVLAIQNDIKSLVTELKLTGAPTVRSVEDELAKLGRGMDRRRDFEALAGLAREAEARAKAAEQQKNKAAVVEVELKAAHTGAQEKWQEVLFTASLKTDFDPSQTGQITGAIGSARSQQKASVSLRKRVSDMRDAIGDIEARLATVLADAKLPMFQSGQAAPALLDIETRFAEHEKAVERASNMTREMRVWDASKALLEKKLADLESQVQALLGTVSAASVDEFRTVAQRVARRKELIAGLDDLRLSHPLLVNDVGKQYRQALEKKSPEDLEANEQKLEDFAAEAEAQRSASQTELGQLAEQRRAIEDSSRTAELHMEVNRIEEQLAEDARKWAVFTIARHTLEKTRDEFQRERQPSLLTAAGRYFNGLTLGRYPRVEAVVGEDRFEVVENRGRRKGAGALSRGTAEQLYLAMRFALIEEYARNAEPLPVIMDDVLVNFDPERSRAACTAILDLASKFQVLFLTCHPQTVDYFRQAAAMGLPSQAGAGRAQLSVVDLPSVSAVSAGQSVA